MHRCRHNARQAQRQESDWEEKLRLAQMDAALLKINDSSRRYKEDVENQISLNPDTTDKELLQLKWLDFLALKIDNSQALVPTITRAPRSRSVSRKPQRICPLQQSWTRVQSVDREKMDDDPTLSFLRWPRAHESVHSKAGSSLDMPKPLGEHCDNGQITGKPQKMKRKVLKSLDQNTNCD
ncbi:hypothetical protein KR038_011048 [Drosophila bunnanda]|nr:hypothetical protein KR038_011048 [Drosophila bunnanda]